MKHYGGSYNGVGDVDGLVEYVPWEDKRTLRDLNVF